LAEDPLAEGLAAEAADSVVDLAAEASLEEVRAEAGKKNTI
jgi:hypothetical protein